ncbi:sugar ABC transporter substrate-binding protein [Streptomyces durbertensis]|uniref:Sugar ABC transporter substrate-binding protein n=1 Tax=Streptomyces durbertensis TaxID=2448886 RepID=A0ABR6EJC7_9ACTN|nr:sugar ABC transporter substrate-binding protein [Streptomyces durbertensis]
MPVEPRGPEARQRRSGSHRTSPPLNAPAPAGAVLTQVPARGPGGGYLTGRRRPSSGRAGGQIRTEGQEPVAGVKWFRGRANSRRTQSTRTHSRRTHTGGAGGGSGRPGGRRSAVLAVGLVLTLALSACSSTGGKRAEEERARGAAGPAAVDTPRWKIAMVTHSGEGDTFWDIVRSGAEQAAAKDNIEFLYSHDKEAGKQAQLVQAAIDQGVDGLVVTLAKPDAMKAVVEKAVRAGIPVVTINSGQDRSKDYGALAHIGQDEVTAGEAVGEELNERGLTKALCVLHEQGNVGHEERCRGVRATFDGTVDNLYVDGTNMPAVESSLEAKLQSDEKVDSVVTLGAPFAATAVKAAKQAGSKAQVSTFDLNAQVVRALKDGELTFAVDQQPYLQGYQAVDLLWLYNYNATMLGGGQPVLTGPQVLTGDDAEALEEYTRRGTR